VKRQSKVVLIPKRPQATPEELASSAEHFAREFNKVKHAAPAALSNAALLRACRNAHKPWIKCGKYFREAYKRAKQGRIPGVRTQADLCRSIGCSIRWLQMVMDGTAADSNKQKASSTDHQRGSGTAEPKSDEDYADEITRYPERELQLLMTQDPQRARGLRKLIASALDLGGHARAPLCAPNCTHG
jgi:hypothetical protein